MLELPSRDMFEVVLVLEITWFGIKRSRFEDTLIIFATRLKWRESCKFSAARTSSRQCGGFKTQLPWAKFTGGLAIFKKIENDLAVSKK